MRKDIVILSYAVTIIIALVLGYFTQDYVLILPALPVMILTFVAFMAFLSLYTEVMRGRSPQVITPAGYWSIVAGKDIKYHPWNAGYTRDRKKTPEQKEDLKRNKPIGDMAFIFPGGIDYGGFKIRSGPEQPIVICPSYLVEQEGDCFRIHAAITRLRSVDRLPSTLRDILIASYGWRVKDYTPIYFGVTSLMDGTLTDEACCLQAALSDEAERSNNLLKKNQALYDDIARREKHRDKTYLVSKVGDVDE